jgi:CheY-like chemotaxis protein
MECILAATERAADLTRQLLAYAGKGHFVAGLVNLTDFIAASADVFRRALPKQVTLDLSLAKDLPDLEIDPNQMKQILINLLQNAGEAVLKDSCGHVTVKTSRCHVTPEMVRPYAEIYNAAPGDYVCLDVADNGGGMEQTTQTKVFDPFFTTKFTGRGLGLAGVQGIVRSYNGFINVESIPGAGSRFQVFLPVSRRTETSPPIIGAQARATGGPVTVLVVDDEPLVRQMLISMVQGFGFQSLEAENGKHALEVLGQSQVRPSIVLLDLTMPVMGGAEVLPILEARYPELKVIAMSGYTEEDARQTLKSESIAGFLQKPYKRETLGEKIKQALEYTSAERVD